MQKINTMKNIIDAVAFAAQKHKSQHRKGWVHVPYINHPIEVARLVNQVGLINDVRCLQAALLHDVLEDTDTSQEEISDRFGKDVLQLILELTDDKTLPSDKQKETQLKTAPYLTVEAKTIRIADKISNIQDMMRYPIWWSKKKKNQYLAWSYEVVKACEKANPALEAHFYQKHRMFLKELNPHAT